MELKSAYAIKGKWWEIVENSTIFLNVYCTWPCEDWTFWCQKSEFPQTFPEVSSGGTQPVY